MPSDISRDITSADDLGALVATVRTAHAAVGHAARNMEMSPEADDHIFRNLQVVANWLDDDDDDSADAVDDHGPAVANLVKPLNGDVVEAGLSKPQESA